MKPHERRYRLSQELWESLPEAEQKEWTPDPRWFCPLCHKLSHNPEVFSSQGSRAPSFCCNHD